MPKTALGTSPPRILRLSALTACTINLLLTPGCGSEGEAGPSATVRDSSGVAIVENHGSVPADAPPWTLSADPITAIGSFDGPEADQLFRVRGALRLPDGRIAVGNSGTNEIRIYRTDGSHEKSWGGEGEGPGEFSSVLLAGRWGDSLVIMDRSLRRITLLHPDEGFVRSFTPEDGAGQYIMGAWAMAGGTVLLRDVFLGDEEVSLTDGSRRDPTPLAVCDAQGTLVADLGHFPGADQVFVTMRTDYGIARVLMDVPFGRSPQIAVAGNRMYFGSQDSYEIGVYRADGALERLVRLDRIPIPVTDAELAAFVEADLADLDESAIPDRRRQLEEMPRMEFRPAHGAVYADPTGYLFVEDYPGPGGDVTEFNVFDPKGRLVARLSLPPGLRPLEIGEDYLLGLYEDDLGVEYLRLYDLNSPRTTPGRSGRS
jgi:hypothetical protein